MRRREFLCALGAAVLRIAARAQPRSVPTIGLFRTTTPEDSAWLVAAVKKGLSEIGFIDEGYNVAIEYRYGHNRYDQLPELAADLVRHNVTVIVVTGGTVAAKAATS